MNIFFLHKNVKFVIDFDQKTNINNFAHYDEEKMPH